MIYRVTHSTRYDYSQPVSLSHNVVRLRPRSHGPQTCLRHRLTIVPAPATSSERLDYFGNYSDYFCLQESHHHLTIAAQSEVEVNACSWADFSHGPSWEHVRDLLRQALDPETLTAAEFGFDSPYVSRSTELANYAQPSFAKGRPFLECVLDLTKRIHKEFKFLPGSTIPPPGQRRLTGADVSHAWVSVFAPTTGWIDFDPTNGLMPSDGHITVAWGRDYSDVGPIQGILVGGRRHRLHVSVDVLPEETPT